MLDLGKDTKVVIEDGKTLVTTTKTEILRREDLTREIEKVQDEMRYIEGRNKDLKRQYVEYVNYVKKLQDAVAELDSHIEGLDGKVEGFEDIK